jgi:hypothetical protein
MWRNINFSHLKVNLIFYVYYIEFWYHIFVQIFGFSWSHEEWWWIHNLSTCSYIPNKQPLNIKNYKNDIMSNCWRRVLRKIQYLIQETFQPFHDIVTTNERAMEFTMAMRKEMLMWMWIGFKVLCVVVHFLQKNNDMRFIVVYFPKLSITVKEFMNASWKKGSVFCCLCVTQVLSWIQKELLMVEMELNLWSCRCLGIRNKLKALESCMH